MHAQPLLEIRVNKLSCFGKWLKLNPWASSYGAHIQYMHSTCQVWTLLALANIRGHGAERRLESKQPCSLGLWCHWSWQFLWLFFLDVQLEGRVCWPNKNIFKNYIFYQTKHSIQTTQNLYNSFPTQLGWCVKQRSQVQSFEQSCVSVRD